MEKEYNKEILQIRNEILDKKDDFRIEFVNKNNLIYLPIPYDGPVEDGDFDILNLEKNSDKFGIKQFIVMCKDFNVDSEWTQEIEKVSGNHGLYAYRVESNKLDTEFWPIYSEHYTHVLFFDPDFKFIGMTSCDDYRVYASSREILECVTGKKIEETIKDFIEFFTPNLPDNAKRFKKIMDLNLQKHYESLANYKSS
jgi:hypothetical protein